MNMTKILAVGKNPLKASMKIQIQNIIKMYQMNDCHWEREVFCSFKNTPFHWEGSCQFPSMMTDGEMIREKHFL